MDNILAVILVTLGGGVIYIAERQQEAGVIAAVLENKGIKIEKEKIRSRIKSSKIYSLSTTFIIIAFLILLALVSNLRVASNWLPAAATILLIGLGAAGCALRALALIRIISEAKNERLPEQP